MQQQMSLAKSLKYKPKTREVRLDQGNVDAVSRISAKRPT